MHCKIVVVSTFLFEPVGQHADYDQTIPRRESSGLLLHEFHYQWSCLGVGATTDSVNAANNNWKKKTTIAFQLVMRQDGNEFRTLE
jgi:hypothetical protein